MHECAMRIFPPINMYWNCIEFATNDRIWKGEQWSVQYIDCETWRYSLIILHGKFIWMCREFEKETNDKTNEQEWD